MLRYIDGQEIQDGDLCSSSRHRTLVRLFLVKISGDIMRVKDLLSTHVKEIKDRDFRELKSGKGKKHLDFELIMRQNDWLVILNKLAQLAGDKQEAMEYEKLPDKIIEAWTKKVE